MSPTRSQMHTLQEYFKLHGSKKKEDQMTKTRTNGHDKEAVLLLDVTLLLADIRAFLIK